MGAIFGHLGTPPEGLDRRMAGLLAHRGRASGVTPVENGFLGVVSNDPADATARSGDTTLVAHAAVYQRDPAISNAGALLHALRDGSLDTTDADYAFASVNSEGTLVLARDFFGCSPLYYTRTPEGIAFASEYKALLPLLESPEADRDMLQHLQHAKRLPLGRTLLRGIESVLPGTALSIAADGSEEVREHPALEPTGAITDAEEAKRLIVDGLTTAVERRTADVDRLGLALSGGIDSIAIAFLLKQIAPDKPLVTVCAGSSPDDRECVTARAVAAHIGSEHHEVITPPGELPVERLRTLARHLEDPFSRSEAFQLFEVGRAARAAGCDVVFSAQGADGLFAGMPKYKLLRLMEKHAVVRKGLQQFWTYTQLGLPPSTLVGRLGVFAKFRGKVPPVPRIAGTSYTPPGPTFAEPGPQFINRSMARGFQAGVCQDIQKFERGFAAHNVEYRSPFYDLDFVRAAYTIDDALKIREGQEKWILRQALSGLVPDEFRDIPKFPQRIAADLDLADALDRLLEDPDVRPRLDVLFEPATLARLRRSGKGPYHYEAAMRIWTAVMTALWVEQFPERGLPGTEPARG